MLTLIASLLVLGTRPDEKVRLSSPGLLGEALTSPTGDNFERRGRGMLSWPLGGRGGTACPCEEVPPVSKPSCRMWNPVCCTEPPCFRLSLGRLSCEKGEVPSMS